MEDNKMVFDANAYKQLTSEYQLFKQGSEHIAEVQENPDFRQNISQVLFGNPNNFGGRPNDVVRKATKVLSSVTIPAGCVLRAIRQEPFHLPHHIYHNQNSKLLHLFFLIHD